MLQLDGKPNLKLKIHFFLKQSKEYQKKLSKIVKLMKM